MDKSVDPIVEKIVLAEIEKLEAKREIEYQEKKMWRERDALKNPPPPVVPEPAPQEKYSFWEEPLPIPVLLAGLLWWWKH